MLRSPQIALAAVLRFKSDPRVAPPAQRPVAPACGTRRLNLVGCRHLHPYRSRCLWFYRRGSKRKGRIPVGRSECASHADLPPESHLRTGSQRLGRPLDLEGCQGGGLRNCPAALHGGGEAAGPGRAGFREPLLWHSRLDSRICGIPIHKHGHWGQQLCISSVWSCRMRSAPRKARRVIISASLPRPHLLIVGELAARDREDILRIIQARCGLDGFHTQGTPGLVLPARSDVIVILNDACRLSEDEQTPPLLVGSAAPRTSHVIRVDIAV